MHTMTLWTFWSVNVLVVIKVSSCVFQRRTKLMSLEGTRGVNDTTFIFGENYSFKWIQLKPHTSSSLLLSSSDSDELPHSAPSFASYTKESHSFHYTNGCWANVAFKSEANKCKWQRMNIIHLPVPSEPSSADQSPQGCWTVSHGPYGPFCLRWWARWN